MTDCTSENVPHRNNKQDEQIQAFNTKYIQKKYINNSKCDIGVQKQIETKSIAIQADIPTKFYIGDQELTLEQYQAKYKESVSYNEQLDRKQDHIFNNYCHYRNNIYCQEELKTITKLNDIWGEHVVFVNGKTQDRNKQIPEFNWFAPQEPHKFTLYLNNLNDVEPGCHYDEFMKYTNDKKTQIYGRIKEKIAKAHGWDPENVSLLSHTKGSDPIQYTNWTLPSQLNAATLQKIEAAKPSLKNEFKQFEKMKVHAAFYRPEFDINMFAAVGHKDFKGAKPETYTHGNFAKVNYIHPNGWTRMGLNVLGKYDSDKWLEPFRNNPELWLRGYHGVGNSGTCGLEISSKIVNSGGLRIGNGLNVYGRGVYWTNNPGYQGGAFHGKTSCNNTNKNLDVQLMVAINPNPNAYSDNSKGAGGQANNYHVHDPKDIRVYGILIR